MSNSCIRIKVLKQETLYKNVIKFIVARFYTQVFDELQGKSPVFIKLEYFLQLAVDLKYGSFYYARIWQNMSGHQLKQYVVNYKKKVSALEDTDSVMH